MNWYPLGDGSAPPSVSVLAVTLGLSVHVSVSQSFIYKANGGSGFLPALTFYSARDVGQKRPFGLQNPPANFCCYRTQSTSGEVAAFTEVSVLGSSSLSHSPCSIVLHTLLLRFGGNLTFICFSDYVSLSVFSF